MLSLLTILSTFDFSDAKSDAITETSLSILYLIKFLSRTTFGVELMFRQKTVRYIALLPDVIFMYSVVFLIEPPRTT